MIDDDYFKEIQAQKRELEKAKIQFRDERNAWQKQNFTDARVDQKLDYLESQLTTLGNSNFKITETPTINSDNDMLIMLSDLHIGQTFNSAFGEYNSDIAKQRLEKYLSEILKIQKRHNSQDAYIVLCGDLISNSIHKTIAITNRENVIKQIKIAIELISSFCYEVSKKFNNVYMTDCSGNHSRIDRKDDALHSERLDDLIAWSVKNALSHVDNFNVIEEKYDIGIANVSIRGKEYIATHGDFDGLSKSSVANLVLMLGHLPYALLMGHRHFPAMTDEYGIRVIQGGCLAGSGDDYTIEKRLTGNPSQSICVCSDNGIECVYPVILN